MFCRALKTLFQQLRKIFFLIIFQNITYANTSINNVKDNENTTVPSTLIDKETSFKAAPYININGGWGKQTNLPNDGGTFAVNLGYRFIESFALETGYQYFKSNQYGTPLYNNYFSGAAKGYYVVNDWLTFFSAEGLGLAYNKIGQTTD